MTRLFNEVLYGGRFLRVEKDEMTGHEIVLTKDSGAVLLFDKTRRKVILIEQSRPAMVTSENPDGIITEVVAGRLDKEDETVYQMIQREIKEEVGLEVEEEAIELLTPSPLAVSPGILTERMYLAFAEISLDEAKFEYLEAKYGADDGEETTRKFFGFDDFRLMDFTDLKTFALAGWFMFKASFNDWIK